jgi:hypothetical protein
MNTTRIEGLRALVERKVAEAIERGGRTSVDAWERLKEQGRLMEDYLVPMGAGGRLWFDRPNDDGPLLAVASAPDGSDLFTKSLHPNGVNQLGERFGIPGGWLAQRASGHPWERDAARALLNKYASNADRKTVLVRAVGDEIRAVLSDRYKRLDTVPVYGSFLSQAYAQGARLYDGAVTDLNSYLEVLLPEVVEVEIAGGDPIHIVFGARIGTSDFGRGVLEVRGFYVQGACLNGMVRKNALREVHLGRRMSDMADIMSDETMMKETEATRSAVGDIVRHLLSMPYRQQTVRLIQAAAGMEVSVQAEVKKLGQLGLLKGEVDTVDRILMQGLYEDGVQCRPSAWKVSQGITAMARECEPQRRRELEVIASDYLDEVLGGIEGTLSRETVEA